MLSLANSLFGKLPHEVLEKIFFFYYRLALLSGKKETLTTLTDTLSRVYFDPAWQKTIQVMFNRSKLPQIPSRDIVLGQIITEGTTLAVTVANKKLVYLVFEKDELKLAIGVQTHTLQLPEKHGLRRRGLHLKVSSTFDFAIITETDGGCWIFFQSFNWASVPIFPRESQPGIPAARIALKGRTIVLTGLEQCVVGRVDPNRASFKILQVFSPFFFCTDKAEILYEEPSRMHAVLPGVQGCVHIDLRGKACNAVTCRRFAAGPEARISSFLGCGKKGHVELRRTSAYFVKLELTYPWSGYEGKHSLIVKDVAIFAGATLNNHELLVLATAKTLPRIKHTVKVLRLQDSSLLHEFDVMFCNGPPTSLLVTDLGLMARHSEHGSSRVEFLQWRLWSEMNETRAAALKTPRPLITAYEESSLGRDASIQLFEAIEDAAAMTFSGGEAQIWRSFKLCESEVQVKIAKTLLKAPVSPVLKNVIASVSNRIARNDLKMDSNFFLFVKLLQHIFSGTKHILSFYTD